MEITIEKTENPEILANLNRVAQDHHHKQYPGYFKEFDQRLIQKSFELLLAKGMFQAIAAFIDGKPAGYALYYFKDIKDNPFRPAYKSLWVDQIAVSEDFQKAGVGSKLMSELENIALSEKADRMELTYWEGNDKAGKFYEKHGYKEHMHFASKKLK